MSLVLTKETLEERIHRIADSLQPEIRNTFLTAVEALKRKLPLGDLTDLLDDGDLVGALNTLSDITLTADDMAPIRDAIEQVTSDAAKVTAAEFGLAFDAVNERAVAFAAAQAGQLVTNIEPDTLTAIRDIIVQGQHGDLGVREQARLIRTVVGLDSRSARAVNRFYQGALESGMTRVQARVAAEKMSARLLARRADNIARTETIRAANMGTELGWVEAMDKGFLPQGTVKVWIATEDARTCFPAGVQVSTPTGTSPIETIQPGDLVTTPTGPKPVAATAIKLYDGEWTAVLDREGQLTVSTSDHLWWSDGWTEAQELKVGDRLQTTQNETVDIVGVANFRLGDTDNLPTVLHQLGVLPSVLDLVMPVGSVDLQSDIPDGEINSKPSHLELLDVTDVQTVKGFSDGPFDTGFTSEPPVTSERTEPAVSSAREDTKLDGASLTVHEDGRTTTGFRTMLPTFTSVELGSAGSAGLVNGVGLLTSERTHAVSVLDRLRNGEVLVAFRADLLNSDNSPASEVTLPTTEAPPSQIVSASRPEGDSTMFTGERVGVDTSSQVVTVSGTEPAVALESLWTDERFIAAVTPVLKAFTHWFISHINGCYPVYDLTVTDSPVFYANDRLVHNCPICAVLDGNLVAVGGSFDIQERASEFSVEGGVISVTSTVPISRPTTARTPPAHPSCRCTLAIEIVDV